ncbi:MAG TPA: galactokinase [Jatrophihabitans sp.]|nr:galactokinase [Jatrophihabitans sp.]
MCGALRLGGFSPHRVQHDITERTRPGQPEGTNRVSRSRCTWRAPGRVNLIGEHTDYNGGFALPFAIEQACVATASSRGGDGVTVVSRQRAEQVSAPVADLRSAGAGWADYALGVVWAMQQRGVDVPGVLIELDSTVPAGAGLSSSAALVCSVATALNDLLTLKLGVDELLSVTRSAENDFVGAPTGGLDQLAALRCTPRHVLLCDMRSLEVRQVPFDLAAAGLQMLVIDTRSGHRHANGEYGKRRAACDQAARQLGVTSLREIDVVGLDDELAQLDDVELRQVVRHVVTENDRVLRTCDRLDAGDLAAIGPLLTASHMSLRDDYQVTIEELDIAVETALAAGALGARMTGGGFGGSVIALVPAADSDECARAVTAVFASRGFSAPVIFPAEAGAGAARVDA